MRVNGHGGSALASDAVHSAPGALAAVLGEIGQKAVHVHVGRAVDEVSPVALLGHQAGVGQFLQMKGQLGGRDIEPLGHHAWCEAFFSSDHEGTEDPEAVLVGERGERLDNVFLIHISIIQEILN